jgi:hypothetical protein
MKTERYVVYTAISAGYDALQPQSVQKNVAHVAFVEDAFPPTPPWTLRSIPEAAYHADPCRSAKFLKILSHRLFPTAEYSIWVDGSLCLGTYSFFDVIRRYLARADLAAFRHPARSCLYEEAKEVMRRRLDDAALVLRQVERYRLEGFPKRAGLVQAGVIIRRQTPAIAAFNEAWWQEIQAGSRRDQISFPYVARKLGLRFTSIPLRHWRGLRRAKHRIPHSAP